MAMHASSAVLMRKWRQGGNALSSVYIYTSHTPQVSNIERYTIRNFNISATGRGDHKYLLSATLRYLNMRGERAVVAACPLAAV
jgi:hypothetical protein